MNDSKNPLCIPDGYRLADQPADCWREDVKVLNTTKKCWEPRQKRNRGVSFAPHMVYIVPFPDIPEGYRLAKPEEHTRKDVKLWLTTSNVWIPRIPSFEGTKFDEKELYIVPLDLPTYSPPGKEKTPMQHKLTEYQIELLNSAFIQLRDFGLSFGYENTIEGSDYWHKVLNNINDKRLNGTSDGKSYVEPEPPIPEGYRKANPDEWTRRDVKYWDLLQKDWHLRHLQGVEFNLPFMQTRYIVPVDPPLTDQDARTRPWIMVKNSEEEQWQGPYSYMAKDERDPNLHYERYLVRRRDGNFEWFCDAREATPEEIKEKLQK